MAGGDVVITLMAPQITADAHCQITRLLAQFELRSGTTRTLADASLPEQGHDCIELSFAADAVDIQALRTAATALGDDLNVDIVIRNGACDVSKLRLVCFDMDSTLIKAEVIDELARRHGVGDEVAAVTEQAMRGELDFKQSFRARMSKLEGLDESVLVGIADELPLMDGVERLMANLKHRGYRTAIISGGFTYFAGHLQAKLGFDEIHANELLVERGKVTGEVQAPIIDAERKAQLLEHIAQREGWSLDQTIAVGDGANDLKMLAKAGLGIAFRAKPLVRAQAHQAISTLGLDAVLYLMGYCHSDLLD